MSDKNKLYKLTGKVQHYSWGGHSFLTDLTGIPAAADEPFAEYWLGAHNNFPSEILGAEPPLLNEYIQQSPSALGEDVAAAFQRLPYLLKVLDVKDMLSIQVHPSKQAASLEYDAENNAGIPLNAPHRNYKDNNHKPELMVALSDFWLLHGFKHAEAIKESIHGVPEFSFMMALFEEGKYENLYRRLMEMDQWEVNQLLQPLLNRIIPKYNEGALRKANPDFWAARAALNFNEPGRADRGIFSIYLLNLVNLQPGEGIFQDAGVLHAYLEGQNMEIMANSDNVLRGGLTPKHIDVKELMKHISFLPITPTIIFATRKSAFEEAFISPARDFQLSRVSINKGDTITVNACSAEIFFIFNGRSEITETEGMELQLAKGESAVAFAGAKLRIKAAEDVLIFRATVPVSE
ncbi:MAG: mannose-6-phosphate isomerase, class I [Chitinophagaceae bacterium]